MRAGSAGDGAGRADGGCMCCWNYIGLWGYICIYIYILQAPGPPAKLDDASGGQYGRLA